MTAWDAEAIIAIIIERHDALEAWPLSSRSPGPRESRRVESRLWRLLQQVAAADRRRLLESLSAAQRMALERWALRQPKVKPRAVKVKRNRRGQ